MINRRSFFRWGIVGLILTRIISGKSSVFAQDNSPSEFYQIGTLDELQSQGYLLNEDLEIGAVLVRQTEDNSLIAIDPTCTHAGCFVEWEQEEKSFVCPCHNSMFKEDGTLIGGLAISDLSRYQVKVDNGIVLVAQTNDEEELLEI